MSRFASRWCRALLFSGVSCVVAACGGSSDDGGDNPPVVIDGGHTPVDSGSKDASPDQGASDSQNETGQSPPDALIEAGVDAAAVDAGNRDAALDSAMDTGRADTGMQDAGRSDDARDVGALDTGSIDARPDVASQETGTREASVADAETSSVDASDATVVETSAAVDDAGFTVDVSVDTGAADAGAGNAHAGNTGAACAAFNGGGGCTPTEQRFVDRSLDCYMCMANAGCLNDTLFSDTGHECGDVTGNAAAGPKTGTARQQLCLDALDCALQTSCGSVDVAICYCGSLGAGNACATAPAGAPDGLCLQKELDGLERLITDAPSVVLPNYTDFGLGAGIANQLFNCAKSNDCTQVCFP